MTILESRQCHYIKSHDVKNLPNLILGGATLSSQYNDDPNSIPIADMIRFAFRNGITAIDTSPYYGDSEIIYGKALKSIKIEFPRDTYFICTKVGRIGSNEFDYSANNVRKSILRSCKRLNTNYLDVVYLHDVEFTPLEDSIEALTELKKLKDEGIIKNFGLSGYPLDYITKLLDYVHDTCSDSIGDLDLILSYCNMNLQNTRLLQFEDALRKNNIKTICNASILSMSLLNSFETKPFHPCSEELKQCSIQSAKYCASKQVDLADLATRYAISKWYRRGPTVIGVSDIDELKDALNNYWEVRNNDGNLSKKDMELVDHIQKKIFKDHLNERWKSGIDHAKI
ncbi:hypothetical protein TPHA_0C02560 [Tetrapisispora phaffii CBS 4417]|uniref:NADP-dependent oxidoreductase domain-containing protein n=1 Tax=Tetrapisispora phaffii (strain ATCC 24235 / CBS 4417 / NBRC 1672 / NRRL Y-8282 / UCD 70-5) TaxID=1071381 RepID=G8BRN3_TETPH|nr:hypothetical protein TPHA_0C02560 [Tetrapisispora phaffii CBS 4417]CCE62409.1 hypothetical protein TPHA_0C02560 [Tetrapisispora phaffii CBS 4417]